MVGSCRHRRYRGARAKLVVSPTIGWGGPRLDWGSALDQAQGATQFPDQVVAQARAAGLNVSRLATAALVEELDRRAKTRALDEYLAALAAELGPIPLDEHTKAAGWVDCVLSPARPVSAKRRRSA